MGASMIKISKAIRTFGVLSVCILTHTQIKHDLNGQYSPLSR